MMDLTAITEWVIPINPLIDCVNTRIGKNAQRVLLLMRLEGDPELVKDYEQRILRAESADTNATAGKAPYSPNI